MGYDETEVFFGKHHDGQDVIAGFRFVVPLAQGTVLTSGGLSLWLEEKYPEGVAVLDRFTDDDGTLLTAHTMDIGPAGGWFQYDGTLSISGNVVVGNGLYACDVGASDGTVKVQFNNKYSGEISGLVFRLKDSDNYWIFYAYSSYASPGKTRVCKVVDGSATLMDEDSLTVSVDTWYFLEVVLSGTSIKCYFNNGLRWDGVSSVHKTETGMGIYSSESNNRLDNFEFVPAGTSGNISFGVSCEDVDNSADFQTGGLPDTRTLTTGYRSLGDISGWNKNDWNTTVDIKIPIQEVLDRPGWASGNHLSVMVIPSIVSGDCKDGERFRVESYDGQPNRAAKLALSW